MSDKAHRATDKRLLDIEKRLKASYDRAGRRIEQKANEYFGQFNKIDNLKRAQVEAGKLSKADYARWRKEKLLYGKKWSRMKEELAKDYAKVRSTALSYINGELPKIYTENYNYFGQKIGDTVIGYNFELINEDTVRNLAKVDSSFLPYEEIDGIKHFRWCTKEINAEILKGVLSGEGIPDLAKRLQSVTRMETAAAVRNARTMVTSAENKARQDGFERAQADGIVIKREWIATMDGRVRHVHALLDGQLADVDKPFRSELGDIMYPGDPSAHPANVYNCRCTLGSKIIGFRRKDGSIERV